MKQKGSAILTALLIGALVLTSAGLALNQVKVSKEVEEAKLGAFRPSGYQGKLLTRLDEGGSESTFNTSPATAPDGSTLTTAKIGDFIVLTVNPGASNEEKISASAVSVSGTTATWTIVNRGLSFTENASVTANKHAHAIGETVIISNDDQFLSEQYINFDDAQTVSGLKTFSGGLIGTASSTFSSTLTLAGATTISNGQDSTFAGLITASGGILSTASSTYTSTLNLDGNTTISAGQSSTFTDITTTATSTFSDGATLGYSIDSGSGNLAVANKSYVDGVAVSGASDANLTTKGIVEQATKAEVAAGTASGGTSAPLFIPSEYATSTSQVATTSVVVTNTSGKIDPSFLDSESYSFAGATFTDFVNLSGTATSSIGVASTSAFTSSFTWTKPSNLKYLVVEVIGGGGGGGVTGTNDTSAAGGGGGGYSKEILLPQELGSTETVTVGAGGTTGDGSSGVAGGGGGTTSFGSHLQATGGSGGGTESGKGGAGGVGSSGDVNVGGSDGESPFYLETETARQKGGTGGSSVLGGGGRGGLSTGTSDDSGQPGNNYGGGGGGNARTNAQIGGSTGATGAVILTEVFD